MKAYAPSSANAFAVARPMPLVPPVISATLPSSLFYRLQHFIACRVLGGPDRADDAIENCWLRASLNPPRFEYEGTFRSWLIRVLIDEALAIRGYDQETNTITLHSEHAASSPSDFVKLAGVVGGTQ